MDGKRDILEEIARLPETERVNERLIDDIVAPQNKAKTPRGGALAIPRPALLGAFAVFAVLLAVLFFCVSLPAANRKPAAPTAISIPRKFPSSASKRPCPPLSRKTPSPSAISRGCRMSTKRLTRWRRGSWSI